MPQTPVVEIDYGARLNEAREIYHSVMMGGGVRTFVDQNGERIEYNQTNIGRLALYIQQLERRLGVGCIIGPMRTYM